jgi:bifunctional DNA-binding transcriptional regulator/antitoxin component of YhaV-PrlF toxin-antitoxin module
VKRRINSKGQVTIPHMLRASAGLRPHCEVEFGFDGEAIHIRPAQRDRYRGARLVAHMRGRGEGTMTTDEIMALTRGE